MSASLGKEEASRPSLDKDDASSSENEDDNDTKGPITTSDAAASFASYEDYLDSQITPTDLFYVEVHTLAIQTWVRERVSNVWRRTRKLLGSW